MKTIQQLLLCGALCLGFTSIAQTGMGTTAPDESAILELQSTTQGFLPPRMTELQMNAIVNPAEGLIVYCTDCTPKGVYVYDGSTYESLMTPQVSATLNCGGTSVMGTATEGEALSGVTITIPYTDGNGLAYNAYTTTSTGVTGLTATLEAGTLANGFGDLVLQVTGTPSSSGDAVFTIDTGVSSSSCAITITVLRVNTGIDTTTPVVDVTSSTGAVWLDRNLGATQVATSSTDAAAYGDLYQWGRAKDGHEQRSSTPTATAVTSADPGHGDFILATVATDNNWTNFAGEDNLWQGESGINNPCPYGYRLPTEAEWDTERLSWATNNAAGAFGSNLKLSLAGYRVASNGILNNVDDDGRYWSSTINGTRSRYLFFTSSTAIISSNSRANGISVRCIKDATFVAASTTLNCGGTTVTGTATENEVLSGVTITIPYTDGNGQPYNAVTTTSTGVTGLTATLAAGILANGSGDLVLQVTGTPGGDGDAVFTIDTGVSSSSCTVTITVLRSDIDTTTAVVDVTSATGAVWMDRNLGATQVATSRTDAAAYGDLYQWGREKDGHEQRNSSNEFFTTATSAEVGHGDFIFADAAIDDNWTNFAGEDNLWQGESGINNPCPYGYRLPTEAEWETERLSWSSNDYDGAFNSNLKLPSAGYRRGNNGYVDIGTVNYTGFYWSSTVSGSEGRSLYYRQDTAYSASDRRADGMSVRCIKD